MMILNIQSLLSILAPQPSLFLFMFDIKDWSGATLTLRKITSRKSITVSLCAHDAEKENRCVLPCVHRCLPLLALAKHNYLPMIVHHADQYWGDLFVGWKRIQIDFCMPNVRCHCFPSCRWLTIVLSVCQYHAWFRSTVWQLGWITGLILYRATS